MKIAINTQALQTDYKLQGTGVYVKHLIEKLKHRQDQNEYLFYHTEQRLGKVDLIHYPYFSAYERVLTFAKPARKFIVTVHDLIPVIFHNFFPPGIKGSINWYIQKYLLKSQVDCIIADSEAGKNDIIEYTNIEENKIAVVYLAADERFKPINLDSRILHKTFRNKYNIPEEFALYVGDAVWTKNVVNLIEAAKAINITLIIVGRQFTNRTIDKKNTWNKELIEVQKTIENDKRIITLGYIPDEDLIKLYNLAVVFCQPSRYEGFGLSVLEALSCGCPVVVSDRGSLPEVVEDAGIYVDPTDTRSIADGIGEIYLNPENYKKYRQLALKQAKKFSWEKTIDQTVKVYEKVLS